MGSLGDGPGSMGGVEVSAALPVVKKAISSLPSSSFSAFRPYSLSSNPGGGRLQQGQGQGGSAAKVQGLRVVVGPPIVAKLTVDIVETYQICDPSFEYLKNLNPKRCLTIPSAGTSNDGHDNENSDLILNVNDALLNSDSNHRYIVKDLLGQGTFGQVAKCWDAERNCFVAVKVIKNDPAYYHQAHVEISILKMLNEKFDPNDEHHIVRIFDNFFFQGHLCIVFEMLGMNLYELLKVNSLRGISLKIIRFFSKQLLSSLTAIREAAVIHCDLKPENILLTTSLECAEIKLIDFGSACMETRTVYSYIQSRFYRSPEVILGYPYTAAIDMWSFGCVVAELFLGLPLFPGSSPYDVLQRMIEILGDQPPDSILRSAKNTGKYFKHAGAPMYQDDKQFDGTFLAYKFLNLSEYVAREKEKPAIGKNYFSGNLDTVIRNYPMKPASIEDTRREQMQRIMFVDFLRGVLQFDPLKRWTPQQAAQHPFITEEPFDGPFQPPPDTLRMPAHHGFSVEHNPGTGHWFGAGLSPQVSSVYTGYQVGSPQYQNSPHASSYGGSIGSYGSYGGSSSVGGGGGFGGGGGGGSSFGSYGNGSGGGGGYSKGYQAVQGMGNGGNRVPPPQKTLQPFNAATMGYTHLASNYRPSSLGASPSQFQASPGSPSTMGSPSRYGPSSPARSSGSGSALGKVAAVGQFHSRRGRFRGSPASSSSEHPWHTAIPSSSMAPPQAASDSGGGHSSYTEKSPQISPRKMGNHHRRQNRHATVAPPNHFFPSFGPGTLGDLMSTSEPVSDRGEDTSPPPGPADWDPNYSEEHFLQDEGEDLASPNSFKSFTSLTGANGNGVVSRSQLGPMSSSVGKHSNLPFQGGDSISSSHRGSNQPQGISDTSPPSLHGVQSPSSSSYGHNNNNNNLYIPPHHVLHLPQQISPSRLGPQPPQHANQARYQYYPSTNLQTPPDLNNNFGPPMGNYYEHSGHYYERYPQQPPPHSFRGYHIANGDAAHMINGTLSSPRKGSGSRGFRDVTNYMHDPAAVVHPNNNNNNNNAGWAPQNNNPYDRTGFWWSDASGWTGCPNVPGRKDKI